MASVKNTANRSPEMTYTIQQFIESNPGDDYICYHNFSLYDSRKVNDDTVNFMYENILDTYMSELKDLAVVANMSLAEQNKYFYNPDLLAYDLYGSVELGFIILKLNGIMDPKEFDIKNVRLVKKSVLDKFLTLIYNAEYEFIQMNREQDKITE